MLMDEDEDDEFTLSISDRNDSSLNDIGPTKIKP